MVDEIWFDFDQDLSGSLGKEETMLFVNQLYSQLGLKAIDRQEFDQRFKDLDIDGNGTVDKQEMVHFVLGLLEA